MNVNPANAINIAVAVTLTLSFLYVVDVRKNAPGFAKTVFVNFNDTNVYWKISCG